MRDRPETIRFYRKRLPHWEVADGSYFVTIRLKGAIPKAGMWRVRELRTRYEEAVANGQTGLEERRAVFREMEHWLDRAPQVAYLADARVAAMVTDAIAHREREGLWTMYSYVIMPNHVHLFFGLGRSAAPPADDPGRSAAPSADHVHRRRGEPTDSAGLGLSDVLTPFKHWTAQQAKRILCLTQRDFWQREWFDHWSRSPEESDGIVRYIHANPVKAGLTANGPPWPWLR